MVWWFKLFEIKVKLLFKLIEQWVFLIKVLELLFRCVKHPLSTALPVRSLLSP